MKNQDLTNSKQPVLELNNAIHLKINCLLTLQHSKRGIITAVTVLKGLLKHHNFNQLKYKNKKL